MPMPNRAGRFRGPIIDSGVAETGTNNLVTVILKHAIEEEWSNGEWTDVRFENSEVTSYHYIEKKDHNLNDRTVATLREVFGWNGHDPAWFQREELPPPCQVTIEWEEYQGQQKLKPRWINPFDSTGGMEVQKSDDAMLRSINNRLGAKLRALSGGSPILAQKPNGTAPTPPPAARTASPPPSARSYGKEEAWAAFRSAGVADGHEEKAIVDSWIEAIKLLNKHEDELTETEWRRIGNASPTAIMNMALEASDLPF